MILIYYIKIYNCAQHCVREKRQTLKRQGRVNYFTHMEFGGGMAGAIGRSGGSGTPDVIMCCSLAGALGDAALLCAGFVLRLCASLCEGP